MKFDCSSCILREVTEAWGLASLAPGKTQRRVLRYGSGIRTRARRPQSNPNRSPATAW